MLSSDRQRIAMAQNTPRAERTKVLSVRFTEAEFEALSARATEIGVGPSTLTRTFVRQALAGLTPSAPAPSATAPADLQTSPVEAYFAANLAANLAARIEALESWVAERD